MNRRIGDRVRQLRGERGWSQEYMAGQLRMSQRGYSKLERGESRWDVERIMSVARLLGGRLEELLPFDTSAGTSAGKNTNKRLIEQYEERIKVLTSQNAQLEEAVRFLRAECEAVRTLHMRKTRMRT
ncbi:MAG TPA: helix-turn-helix transcriptional regulator [Flavobacteriales bacterium]|nr:helix-turn-helix transcriptional regulator [Flavobacteriales bacterium]